MQKVTKQIEEKFESRRNDFDRHIEKLECSQARSYHYAKKPGLAHYFVKISLNVTNYASYRAYDNVILWKN